jgi:aldehyde:ferredoxin oxidoreductase
MSGDEYMEIGKRIQILRTMFNNKHGITQADRVLPARMEGKPPFKSGPLKNVSIDTPPQVKFHWQAMGCDPVTGVPLDVTIEKLGIKNLLEMDVK